MSNLNGTLKKRGSVYGSFENNAKTSQELKRVIHEHENFHNLNDAHVEAFEMIFHKISRILNGDPNYADSWHDIAGYATLVEKAIEGNSDECK